MNPPSRCPSGSIPATPATPDLRAHARQDAQRELIESEIELTFCLDALRHAERRRAVALARVAELEGRRQ